MPKPDEKKIPQTEEVTQRTSVSGTPEQQMLLRVIEGKDVGTVFAPQPGSKRFTVGRGQVADFRLQDQKVSRIHFAVEITPAGFVLSDENSSNGTFLDDKGERVSRVELLGGEEIRIGKTRLKVEISRPEKAINFPLPSPDSGEQPVPRPEFPRLWAALLVMLVAIASSYSLILLDKPSFFASGPVTAGHASWEGKCVTCHPPWGGQTMNATCGTADCHASVRQTNTKARDNCIDCHTEHRGRSFNIKGDATRCWSCHETGFQERPLWTHYKKVFIAAGGKEGSPLRPQLPASEAEQRTWQQSVPSVENGLIFAHAAHAHDSGIKACEACHQPLPGEVINALGVISAFPTHEECIECHKEVVDSNPDIARASASRQCRKCHTREDGTLTRVQRTLTYVQFSHDNHKATECVQCHFVVTGEQTYRPVLRSAVLYPLPMEACVSCHEQQQVTTTCLDCHRVHHSFAPGIRTTGSWLSRVTLSYVLLVLLIMVAGACVYAYFDPRLAQR